MSVAITCKQVKKKYGKGHAAVEALRGIDLEIALGELTMLVGPSGSGKTTLISVIAGILDRDSGECEVFGRDLQALPNGQRTAARGKDVGFVFQAFNLIPTLTIAENVAIPLLILGVKRDEALARAQKQLGEVGLGERHQSRPVDLSGGEQQRVAICRAIIHEPRLIVCDEPTSNLDHETGAHVMHILKEMAGRADRSIIVVTHDARIFEYGDKIAHMDDGRIVEEVTPSNG